MQWWCSAQTAAWSWSWRPYPGVWLFVALAALACWTLWRRFDGEASSGRGASLGPAVGDGTGGRGRRGWCVAGLLLLWLALDWPVGPLAASYLASVHMGQMVVLALLVPPLLLAGVPPAAFRALGRRPLLHRAVRAVTHPVVALLVFNGVVVGTHVPAVLDTLSASQVGMMGMDLAWLGAGLVFWWPVLAPVPRRRWFSEVFQVGYLFLNTVPVTLPYSFLVFAELPVYATYELAPPLPGVSTMADQQVAGLVMKLGGGLVLWTAITILFFRWYRAEQAEEEGPAAGGHPAAGAPPAEG